MFAEGRNGNYKQKDIYGLGKLLFRMQKIIIINLSDSGKFIDKSQSIKCLKKSFPDYELEEYQDTYESNDFKLKSKRLMDAFRDPDCKIILTSNGGKTAINLLSYIDFESIGKNEKMIIGYSDIDHINLAIHKKCGFKTVFGGVAKSFKNSDINLISLKSIISNRPQIFEANQIFNSPETEISGDVVISNIQILNSLVGTDFLPDLKNKLLFIEDHSGDVNLIKYYLKSLELSNIFGDINGLIIGYMGKNIDEKDILDYILLELNIKCAILKTEKFGDFSNSLFISNGNKCLIKGRTVELRNSKPS